MKKSFPPSRVSTLLEPGPVVLVAQCYASFECRVVDTKLAARHNFFALEVRQAWIDPARKHPRTIHHMGRGAFMVAGRTIKRPSRIEVAAFRGDG